MEKYNEQEELEKEDINEDELLPKPIKPIKPVTPTEIKKPEPSFQEMQSVGRLYLNLTKSESIRWKKFAVQEKKSNIGIWWELREKYEDELEKHAPQSDEDEPEEPTKKKKKSK